MICRKWSFINLYKRYSGRNITASFSYVTERGEGKGNGGSRRQKVCLSMFSITEKIFPLLISTQSVAFSCTNFFTAPCFVNQRNYKPLAVQAHALTRTRNFKSLNVIISHQIVYKEVAVQAHALTRTRNFKSLNVIISHQIVYKEGLGYLSVCAVVSRSSPPSPVCICNGQRSSELCCGHYNAKLFHV
jgi:hypothetical protein